MPITTGAPNTAVTELMLRSVGAKAVRAMRSHRRQKAPPPRKQAGIMRMGFAVPKSRLIRWGTAMPTKEMGPAKAVTQEERTLDSRISTTRKARMLTPTLLA